MELGNMLGHALPELDVTIQTIRRSLKEKRSLNVEQSNIGALTLTVQSTMQALKSNIERGDENQTIVLFVKLESTRMVVTEARIEYEILISRCTSGVATGGESSIISQSG
jgi:hypothetical protein